MELFVSAANATVHINDYGTPENCEKTIILLHGYLETMYIWSELAESLQDRYRILTMDMPGHGISSTAPGGAPNSMEYCAEVVKGVLDKCNVEKAIIAGHSMGGYVALLFAKLYPQMCEKVILFNSNPYPEDPSYSTTRTREISVINAGKLEAIASLSIPKMYYHDNLRRVDDKVCETVELCEMHDPQGIIASIKGMATRPDMSEWLKEGQNIIPFMIICGDNDHFITMECFSKMKEQFHQIRFEILENTGHNSFIEAGERCLELVKDFVG